MMPAAVIVATVADPVARRMSTATSQPGEQRGDRGVGDPAGDDVADAGVHEGLLEPAARARR